MRPAVPAAPVRPPVPSAAECCPRGAWAITISPEFVAVLRSGEHPFEVLAIEAGGNQTITEGTFEIP